MRSPGLEMQKTGVKRLFLRDRRATLEEATAGADLRWMKMTRKLWRTGWALSLRAEGDVHWLQSLTICLWGGRWQLIKHKHRPTNRLPSARHSGPCVAAWIETADGQQRKYDHKSPAADSYLNPAHIEAAGRFPSSCRRFTCSAVLENGVHLSV